MRPALAPFQSSPQLVEVEGIEPSSSACKAVSGPSTTPELVRAGGFDPPASCSQGTRSTRLSYALTLALILLVFAAPVHAEDADPWLEIPRGQLADLLAKSAELDATKIERDALKGTVVAQDAQIKAQAALIKIQDDMIDRQAKLTALADEGATIHEKRAARIEEDACKRIRTARMTGYAAAGAGIGSAAFPGIGTLIGGAIGAATGYLLPCE